MPQFDGVSGSEPNTADSIYNALQIKWEKRFSQRPDDAHALHLVEDRSTTFPTTSGNLTWLGGTTSPPGSARITSWNVALAATTCAHRFIATGDWQIPFGRGTPFWRRRQPRGGRHHRRLGIERLPDAAVRLPAPGHRQNGGKIWNGTQRPNLIGDPATPGSIYDRLNNYFNRPPSRARPSTFGHCSALPRICAVRSSTPWTWRCLKSWQTTERQRLEFRLEASNVRNHPVFANPAPPMGRATSARSPAPRSARAICNSV